MDDPRDDEGLPRSVREAFGHGSAAQALVITLLAHLAEKKIISRDEGLKIIDRALSGLEWVAEGPPGPGLDEARQLLEQLLLGWSNPPKP